MIITKMLKKSLLSWLVVAIILQTCGCSRIINGHSCTSDKSKNNIENQDKDTIKSANFVNCSLQDGFAFNVNGNLITRVSGCYIFQYNAKDTTYPFSKMADEYLGVGEGQHYYIEKLYNYKNKLIYTGAFEGKGDSSFNGYRAIIIQDITTGEKKIIKLDCGGSGKYYILGDRIYFDEVIGNKAGQYTKYLVKYLNITSQKQNTVFEYNTSYQDASFVIRKDGAVAFSVSDSKEFTVIKKYNKGVYTDVVKKRWCALVDYDDKGVFYTEPAKTDAELNQIEYNFKVYEYWLILNSDKNKNKTILKRKGDDVYKLNIELKVFDNFFLLINDEDTYYRDYIEKYDFEGKQIKKFTLKQWPILGKGSMAEDYVVYYNGKIVNFFCRGYRNVLESQEVDIQ